MLTKQLNFFHTLPNIREKLGPSLKLNIGFFRHFHTLQNIREVRLGPTLKLNIYTYIGVTIILFYLTTCFIKLTRGETCSLMTSLVHVWLTTSNAEISNFRISWLYSTQWNANQWQVPSNPWAELGMRQRSQSCDIAPNSNEVYSQLFVKANLLISNGFTVHTFPISSLPSSMFLVLSLIPSPPPVYLLPCSLSCPLSLPRRLFTFFLVPCPVPYPVSSPLSRIPLSYPISFSLIPYPSLLSRILLSYPVSFSLIPYPSLLSRILLPYPAYPSLLSRILLSYPVSFSLIP